MSTKTNKAENQRPDRCWSLRRPLCGGTICGGDCYGVCPHPLSHRSVCKLGHFRVHLHDVCYESTKTGAILILSVAVGLLTSTGGVWVSLIWCLALGIVAELIARAGNHKSKKSYILSYVVFACSSMSPFWMLLTPNRLFFSPAKLIMGPTMPQRWISSPRAGLFWF